MRSCRGSLAVCGVVLAFSSFGCVKQMLINGQIEGTRKASGAFDTVGDFEMAYNAASASLVQFEGMHVLAPKNTDALFLLTKGWTGFAFGFIEDEMEEAEDAGARKLAEHHRARAVAAYDRAIGYGLELLAFEAEDFEAARKDEPTLKAWLAKHFDDADDAPNLFWTGYAWMAKANIQKDDAETVANLWVGVAMMERAVELDETYNNYSGLIVLGSYHARTASADLETARKLFDSAIEKTGRKSLLALFQYGAKYACAKADAALYGQLLGEVVQSEDQSPNLRLMNTIARRRARRWLGVERQFEACGIEGATPPSAVSSL